MEEYKRMFEDAIRSLAAIDEALGLPEETCNGPLTTLAKIRELHDETSGRWISIHERRPMIDDETPYLGVNSQGFVGAFNHLLGLRGQENDPVVKWCGIYLTAEEQIDVLDGIEYWMPVPAMPNAEVCQPEGGKKL